jgi:hypothetical protein
MINMTKLVGFCRACAPERVVLRFRRFFPKLEFFAGFSLHNINFAERKQRSCDGGWGRGGGNNVFFRVQCSSIRVQRSSVGCSEAQKGAA